MNKRFLYCEATEGGMDQWEFFTSDGLIGLHGWMDRDCRSYDEDLVAWLDTAEIGEYYEHRLGVVVRLKDAELLATAVLSAR